MSKAKQKGNRLERDVARFYNRKLDKQATRMPLSGAANGFKGDIQKRFWDGWTDECKSKARMAIYDLWEQTQQQAGDNSKPVLFIRADFKPILAVIRIEDYFDMREELQDWQNIGDDLKSEISEKVRHDRITAGNKIRYVKLILNQILKLIEKE
jgi:hypothetical protein